MRLPHASDRYIADPAAIAASVERLMADPADRPEGIIFARDGFGLHQLSYRHDAGAYADQAGNIVTRWASDWGRPELWLFDLHHQLFAGATGETVQGVIGLCGLFFVGSGALLWWQRRRTFAFRLLPRRLTRSAIRWHHRDLGIVVAPLLLLSLYTGVTMAFRPVSALVLGPSAPGIIARALKPPKAPKAALAERFDWGEMIRTAHARFPTAEFRILSLPRRDSGLIMLRMKQPEEWLPNGRTTLYFAADTGRLIDARDALAQPAQARGYNMLFPLHAAKVGGLAYRLLMTLSGLALTLLGSMTVATFWFSRRSSP